MKKKVRVGILGAGFIAGHHIECFNRVYGIDVEVVGVYDIFEDKCSEFARNHNIKAFSSVQELLSEVDAVDICTPPFAHAQNIIEVANAKKHIMCEKPLAGYAPDKEDKDFNGMNSDKNEMLRIIRNRLTDIKNAVENNKVNFTYFENFIYTPQVQKEAEIISKTKSQILRMIGEESHKGNHATYSNQWKYACGGSLISTGSHPVGGILYLKRVEGEASNNLAIRPKSVSARTHELTKIENYRDEGFLRSDYFDVEDYAWAHIEFEDGTVGDVVTGATVLGGIKDFIDVFANNHSTRCNINPVGLIETYNPVAEQFKDIYTNYGISTKEGWLYVAPDENWMFGYQAEVQDAIESIANNRQSKSCLELAVDTINVIYSAYLSAQNKGAEVFINKI